LILESGVLSVAACQLCAGDPAEPSLKTAVAGTVFNLEEAARDSADPPRNEDFRALVGPVDADFVDVLGLPDARRAEVLDPDSFAASQAYGREVRPVGMNGVAYHRSTATGTATCCRTRPTPTTSTARTG
jgi:hypothetical protein